MLSTFNHDFNNFFNKAFDENLSLFNGIRLSMGFNSAFDKNSLIRSDPLDDFFHSSSLLSDTSFGFGNGDVTETDEGYVVRIADANAKDKNILINYDKSTGILSFSSSTKKDEENSHFESTSQSSYTFEKPVNHENIKASLDDDAIIITVPKSEKALDSNIVNIAIEDSKAAPAIKNEEL